MAKSLDRSQAFAEAAQMCRTRASGLSPATATNQEEFELMGARIEELETLAYLFDTMGNTETTHIGMPINGKKDQTVH